MQHRLYVTVYEVNALYAKVCDLYQNKYIFINIIGRYNINIIGKKIDTYSSKRNEEKYTYAKDKCKAIIRSIFNESYLEEILENKAKSVVSGEQRVNYQMWSQG